MRDSTDAAELLGYLMNRRDRQAPISGLRRSLQWNKARLAAALTVLVYAQMVTLFPNLVTLRPELRELSFDELIRLTEHHLSHKERTDAETTDEGNTDAGNVAAGGG